MKRKERRLAKLFDRAEVGSVIIGLTEKSWVRSCFFRLKANYSILLGDRELRNKLNTGRWKTFFAVSVSVQNKPDLTHASKISMIF